MTSYRIVKAADADYRVQYKVFFCWNQMNLGPGFINEGEARDYVRRVTKKPEVVAVFHTNGEEVK